MEEMTAGQFLVALFMSLGGLCAFIWGALTGQFVDIEGTKFKAYCAEIDDEQR